MVVGRGQERLQSFGHSDTDGGLPRLGHCVPVLRHRSVLHLHPAAVLLQVHAPYPPATDDRSFGRFND